MRHATATGQLRNFHLPLPDDVYQALRDEAAASKQPATAIARQAIETWLRDRKRTALREAIAAYASENAGTSLDLDPAVEAAGLEVLRPARRRRQ
jgi:hypothetical protein